MTHAVAMPSEMPAAPCADTLPAGAPAVRLQSISKWFDTRGKEPLTVLQNVSIDVPEQSVVALVGASGCGKSTILNIMSGLLTPDRGCVFIHGTAAADYKAWRSVGYMFQEDRLLPWRTALDNTAFGLEAETLPRRERNDRAMAALELVGLAQFAAAFPHELSGGMRSRVALARSLVTRPTLLLMDEPFSKLDPMIRSQMHDELLRIKSMMDMTIVFVTHDVEEAVVLADQVVLLMPRPGRVRSVMPVPLARPRDPNSQVVSDEVRRLRPLI
jgi:ABC-type nitrate/sulfonate/bicarbonate transport system ATPase subunit